jgi:hypothetical protein
MRLWLAPGDADARAHTSRIWRSAAYAVDAAAPAPGHKNLVEQIDPAPAAETTDHERYMTPHQHSKKSNHKSDHLEDEHGKVSSSTGLTGRYRQ